MALVTLPPGQLSPPLPPSSCLGKCLLLMTAEALLGGKAMFTQLLLSWIPNFLLFNVCFKSQREWLGSSLETN